VGTGGCAGGSYGGDGGGTGNPPYGSALVPDQMGSGAEDCFGGGRGGGGLILIVAENFTNLGVVRVDGGGGIGANDAGGSGGGIFVNVTNVLGVGFYSSVGGDGNPGGARGAGGGGRIAIHANNADSISQARINVDAGDAQTDGQMGTAVLIDKDDNTIIARNGFRVEDVDLTNGALAATGFRADNVDALRLGNNTILNMTSSINITNTNLTTAVFELTTDAPITNLSNSFINNTLLNFILGTTFDDANATYRASITTLRAERPNTTIVNYTSPVTNVFNLSEHITLANNLLRVNSTAVPGLNTTAIATIFSNVPSPLPIVDPEDDGSFAACNPPRCVILGSTANSITFSVASFTSYATVAGVQLVKNDTPDPVFRGNTLTYNITINTTTSIVNLTLNETYPPEVVFSSSQPAPTVGNNFFALGSLAANESFVVNITVIVSSSVVNNTAINNTANITFSNGTQTFTAQVTENTTVFEPPIPSLLAVKIDSVDPVARGAQLNYTITINNTGTGTAFNTTMVELYPAGVIFDSSSPVPSSSNDTFSLGNISPGASTTVNITVNVSSVLANGTLLNNIVNVTFENSSGQPESVFANEQTNVLGAPNLTMSKVDNVDPVVAGDQVVYTLTITNSGDDQAFSVTVTDNYPNGTTFVSAQPVSSQHP